MKRNILIYVSVTLLTGFSFLLGQVIHIRSIEFAFPASSQWQTVIMLFCAVLSFYLEYSGDKFMWPRSDGLYQWIYEMSLLLMGAPLGVLLYLIVSRSVEDRYRSYEADRLDLKTNLTVSAISLVVALIIHLNWRLLRKKS